MAYDENLADRVRALLEAEAGFSERKVFGGIAFMLDGDMCCGVVDSELMLRLGPDGADTALEHPTNGAPTSPERSSTASSTKNSPCGVGVDGFPDDRREGPHETAGPIDEHASQGRPHDVPPVGRDRAS
jgi:hypothetical protein